MEQANTVTDLSLIGEISNGNKNAFRTLYNKYVRQVYSYVFKITRDNKITEEITNDVMFEVWKSAASFKGKSKVLTWIFGIAHNKTMNEIRKKTETPIDPEHISREISKDAQTEELLVKKDRDELMRSALDQLSAEQRAVVELTFLQGLSYIEIAEIIDCPVNTVKTRMFYAKENLKEIFLKLGITTESV